MLFIMKGQFNLSLASWWGQASKDPVTYLEIEGPTIFWMRSRKSRQVTSLAVEKATEVLSLIFTAACVGNGELGRLVQWEQRATSLRRRPHVATGWFWDLGPVVFPLCALLSTSKANNLQLFLALPFWDLGEDNIFSNHVPQKVYLHTLVGVAVRGPGRQMLLWDKHRWAGARVSPTQCRPPSPVTGLRASAYASVSPKQITPHRGRRETLPTRPKIERTFFLSWWRECNLKQNTSLLRGKTRVLWGISQYVVNIQRPVL